MGGAHTREALSPPVSGSPLMKCGAAVLYASISDMQVLCCAYLRAECRKMESSSKLQTANSDTAVVRPNALANVDISSIH